MAIKITKKFLTVEGRRVAIVIAAGPWVEGINPNLIKIRTRGHSSFPASFREHFAIENNSDMTTDYFETNSIRILPGHPLYDQVKAVAS